MQLPAKLQPVALSWPPSTALLERAQPPEPGWRLPGSCPAPWGSPGASELLSAEGAAGGGRGDKEQLLLCPRLGGFGSVALRLWLCVLPQPTPPGLDPAGSSELLTGHLQDVLPWEGLVGGKG